MWSELGREIGKAGAAITLFLAPRLKCVERAYVATGVTIMATRPATGPTITPPETIEQRFRRLEAAWVAATGVLSDDADIVEHPAFREIIGMGEAVVPLMLRDLEQRPRLWVWALPQITGEDPVPVPDRGNIARMSEAWLRWGKAKGYR
jgi:hypothetical protein